MPSYTNDELAKIEKELKKIYKQTQVEVQEKWDEYMAKAKKKTVSLYMAINQTGDPDEIAKLKKEYESAMLNMTLQNAHYQSMVDQVTDKLADTNQLALDYINGNMPKVYCHSYNEFGDKNIKGYSFELVNEESVKNLIKDGNKSLLPQKALNIPKDKQWNTKNINSQVLQGILQGESIPKIASRLQHVTDMNHKSAVRNARTMVTGAENKGRQDSFIRAVNDGVIMKRRWVATFGDRTRDWHADLNGVEVDIDEPWQNDYGEIMYPGDPSAHPANVYNCRCSIRAIVKGFKPGTAKKVVTPVATPKPDLGMYQDKSMTATYYSVKAENKDLGKEFWSILQAEDNPSNIWSQYLIGTAPKDITDKLDKILLQHKGTGSWSKPVSAKAAAKKAADATVKEVAEDKALTKAKEKLAIAQGNLDSLGKKTYSGIWKEDVTLADYETKKAGIAAKKAWYEDQIDHLDAHFDDLESWEKAKLAKYKQYLEDLEEFETKGQLYAQYSKEYAKAAKKVKDLTPVGETFGPDAYTQERKNSAKWFTRSTYSDGDRYYTQTMGDVHKNRTNAEYTAYRDYTSASGPFNRPLAGFDARQGSGASGWSEKNYVGPGKVPIDNEGKGKRIKDLTSLIQKSTTQDDIWIQTAQNYATLEGKRGFLGIDYGTLENMTDSELQKFVGTTSEFTQFISGSINRGGGSYTPGGMRINIYVPQGSEALYVLSDGSFGKSEHEIILQRGGTYRITKMYWGQDAEHGGRKLIVDMDLLTGYGYNKFE